MYVGLCMSCIDHGRNTRSEAREIASKLSREFDLNHIEIVLEGIGRRHAPYPWEWEEAELREVADFIEPFERKGAHLPFFSMNVIAANEGVREEAMKQMQMAIDISKQLDLDYGVVHATGSTEGLALHTFFFITTAIPIKCANRGTQQLRSILATQSP